MLNFLAAIAAAVLNDKIGNDEIAGWISKAIKAVSAGRLVDENLKSLTEEVNAFGADGNPDDEDFESQESRSDAAHDAIQGTDLGQGGGGTDPNAVAGGNGGSSGDDSDDPVDPPAPVG